MPRLSVIIPTHKRAPILAECLRRLTAQTVARDIEIIVVSDVSDPEARNCTGSASATYVEITPCQQGIARNEGLKYAKGEYVLFIGDDIFLSPDACEMHLKMLTAHPDSAVLGFTTWDPAVGITPVMRWLEESGWQFGYPKIAQYAGKEIPNSSQHLFSYTSHISLPISVARAHLFRTDVSLYGWEDIEWGMRLKESGVKLFYEQGAKAFHHHHLTLEQSLARMETLGRSAREIEKKVPGFDRVPRGFKRILYRSVAILPGLANSHRKAFLRGLDNA